MSPVLMDFGYAISAWVTISNMKEVQFLQDTAAERCSICYRPPELFQVSSSCDLDERTDQSPYDPLYERGNSVALAVQIGKISFPASSGQYSQELLNLVMQMTNVDINFRIRIDSVIEKIEQLQLMEDGPEV